MLILAIESSCDETSAAIIKNGREVLSLTIDSQVPYHKMFGGVVPEIASRKHIESIASLTTSALKKAGVTFDDISALAVTYSPGLVGSLLVGVNFVKGISISTGLPIVPVNHLKAHIAANYIEFEKLEPPFIGVVASGGHTSIFHVINYTDFKLLGSTRDDAIGETFDKVARAIGIPYPGGAELDVLSESGETSAYKFSIPTVEDSEYDMSFSGLKTAVINFIRNSTQKNGYINTENLAASFSKAAIDNLIEKVLKASKNLGLNKIVLSGGVAANTMLRKSLQRECTNKKIDLYIPSLKFCSDNAAMVGAQGHYELKNGNTADLSLNAEVKAMLNDF